MPSKFVCILRITFSDTQLCGRCLINMTPVVKVVIHCVLHYYKRNTLAIIIIYKEQCACNQPNVYQYGESWTIEANAYHTLCAAHRTTSLNTKYQLENSGGNRQTRTAEITRHSSSPPRRGAVANCQCNSVYCSFAGTRYYIGLFVSSRNE